MNLNAIAFAATRAVTPPVAATLRVSTGSTRAANYKPVPTYAADVPVQADVQAVSGKDLKQLDGLNIQGVDRVAYLNGAVEGLNRHRNKGGDLLVFSAGAPALLVGTWLVVAVLEGWDTPGWCKVAITLQVDP